MKGGTIKSRAGQRDAGLIGGAIGQVELSVHQKVGMKRDLEKTREECCCEDLRDSGHRNRVQDAVVDQAEAPVPFGDQDVSVREEGQAPRMGKPGGEHTNENLRFVRGVKLVYRLIQPDWWDTVPLPRTRLGGGVFPGKNGHQRQKATDWGVGAQRSGSHGRRPSAK
jgi:hypothetical protein